MGMPRLLAFCFACLILVTGFSMRREYLEAKTPPPLPNLELIEGVAGARQVGDKLLVSEVRSLWPAEVDTAQRLLDNLHPKRVTVEVNRIFETERSDEQVQIHRRLTSKVNDSLTQTLGPNQAWAFLDIDTHVTVVTAEKWEPASRFPLHTSRRKHY